MMADKKYQIKGAILVVPLIFFEAFIPLKTHL